MRILILNTFIHSETNGYAYVLFKALKNKGIDVKLVCHSSQIEESFLINYSQYPKSKFINFYEKLMIYTTDRLCKIFRRNSYYFWPEIINLYQIPVKKLLKKIHFYPDIVISLWTKYSFNMKTLYMIHKEFKSRIFLIPTDMAPLTGGCHYSYDCDRWKQFCGRCPQIKSKFNFDVTYLDMMYKRKYINKTPLEVIPCTYRVKAMYQCSSLFRNTTIHDEILLGVDHKVFSRAYRNQSRNDYSILSDEKVVFFGAMSIRDPRKGYGYFIEALRILSNTLKQDVKNHTLLMFASNVSQEKEIYGFKTKTINIVNTQQELAKMYSLADVFVCPSIADDGPYMVNQFIVAGIPVVMFDIGVSKDLIKHKTNGYIAKYKSPKDLAEGMRYILELEPAQYSKMCVSCREIGVRKASMDNHILELNKVFVDQCYFNQNDTMVKK